MVMVVAGMSACKSTKKNKCNTCPTWDHNQTESQGHEQWVVYSQPPTGIKRFCSWKGAGSGHSMYDEKAISPENNSGEENQKGGF